MDITFVLDFLYGIFQLDFLQMLPVLLHISFIQHSVLPIPSYKYQLQQMGSHKYTTACSPSLAIFFIGELAVSLFLLAGNVCTSHFLGSNDLELFSKIVSLNGEILIKRRQSLWRRELSSGRQFFKTLAADSCLSSRM